MGTFTRSGRLAHVYALTLLLLPTGASCAQEQAVTPVPYGYYHQGELVSLTPSPRLVAVSEAGTAFRAFVSEQRLERDPRSEHPALRARNLALYRRAAPVTKAERVDLPAALQRFAGTTPEEVQPVFEQGQVLLIPANEIIVGFTAATTLEQAQRFAAGQREAQGIVDVRAHRRNSYILVIDNPANGRVYQVSQFLAGLDELEFAEPNHIVLPAEAPEVH